MARHSAEGQSASPGVARLQRQRGSAVASPHPSRRNLTMAQRTITRLYDTYSAAVKVVDDLEVAGVPHIDISIVSRDPDNRDAARSHTNAADDAGKGAGMGAILGGGAGLL